MDYKQECKTFGSPVPDPEMPFFDLESEQLDFDSYLCNISSDTESSMNDCDLDESFQQIKNDLKKLLGASSMKPSNQSIRGEPPVIDDEFPDVNILERFDIMKGRLRKRKVVETEKIRQFIIELNKTSVFVNNSEGKMCKFKIK